jgi:hypothetical protein
LLTSRLTVLGCAVAAMLSWASICVGLIRLEDSTRTAGEIDET